MKFIALYVMYSLKRVE